MLKSFGYPRIHPKLSLPQWKVLESCGELLDSDDAMAWETATPVFRSGILQFGIINRRNHIRKEYTLSKNHLLVIMLQGHLSICFDGHLKRLKQGDMATIPAGTRYLKTGAKGHAFSHIHFKISDTKKWRGLKSNGPSIRCYDSAVFLYQIVWQILDAYAARDSISREHAHRDSCTLVDLLTEENRIGAAQPGQAALALRELVSQIRQNPASDWKNDEMALSVNMSERTFLRSFKREFGTTPKTMVVQQRMMLARRRLEFTEDKVEKVAQDVGYANRSVFSELFLKHVGVRPGHVRQESRVDS